MEIQAKYPGLEVVNVGQPVGTPQAVILEQLELLGPGHAGLQEEVVACRGDPWCAR
jgi:hypothetical protein